MTDKRCPKCGMSMEEYQDKCECGFEFKGKTDGEIEQIAEQTRFGKKVAAIFAVLALLAGPLFKAFMDSFGYGATLIAVAALVIVAVVLWLIVRAVERRHKK